MAAGSHPAFDAAGELVSLSSFLDDLEAAAGVHDLDSVMAQNLLAAFMSKAGRVLLKGTPDERREAEWFLDKATKLFQG